MTLPRARTEGHTYFGVGPFDVRIYADRVEITRRWTIEGEPGELEERITFTHADWHRVALRVVDQLNSGRFSLPPSSTKHPAKPERDAAA
jgi:hypothetical protein